MIERVMVVGGGTGGHLFPGIAVVEELRRRNPRVEVMFVGTERGIEARVLPRLGEKLELVDVRPWLGRSPLQLARNVSLLPKAVAQATALLRKWKPQLVVGLGGYTAGPVLMLAAALRIPTALLEQNAHVGLTNRLLSNTVGRAYLTYPQTLSQFGAVKGRVLGNPVRRSFVEAAQLALTDPAGVEARARRVLVLGGSQGAKTLNDVVPAALALASLASLNVSVLHQTGESQVEAVKRRYQELGVDAEVVPFIDDMARAYASASLVIARAGATTLAELCAIGKPSILIPYPHAAEDHQMKNARAMEQAGAALAIAESELSAEGLAKQARALLIGRAERQAMADAARALGRPEAAAAIVDDLCTYLGVPVDGGTGTGGQGDDYSQGSIDPGARSSAQVTLSSLESGANEAASAADGVNERLAAYGVDGDAAPYREVLTRPAVRKPRVRRAPLRVRAVEHAVVH